MTHNTELRIYNETAKSIVSFGSLGFFSVLTAAWVTHVAWTVTGGQLLLGLLGSPLPPVGGIPRNMNWFGVGF